MQVSRVSNTYNPCFRNLTLSKDARVIINNMSDSDRKQFRSIAKSISDTVHWNLRVKADELNPESVSCCFVNKHNSKDIFPGGYWICGVSGNKVSVASLSTKGKTRYEDLVFPNEDRVKAMTNMDNRHSSIILSKLEGNLILSRIKRLAEQIRFLDEASEYKLKNDKI